MQYTRIKEITIENFKNVQHGVINFENKKKEYNASIVGLYGQNGSGKTALIDALQVLKYVLCGKSVPNKYVEYIRVNADNACLKYHFEIFDKDDVYNVWYQFSLGKEIDDSYEDKDDFLSQDTNKYKVKIFDELLSFNYSSNNEKIRKTYLIDTNTSELFVPKSRYNELLENNNEDIMELLLTKRLILTQSRSFIFSKEMINKFREGCNNKLYLNIINRLSLYGNNELFIIDTQHEGLINMDALPLAIKYHDKQSEMIGRVLISLNKPSPIPNGAIDILYKAIDNMNIVLQTIIPGLTIDIIELETVVNKDGDIGKMIQLVSLKNGIKIPFRYESEGIKKIVSILQLLIVAYNNSSITVAIDELDFGIYEYLLGELLSIIAENGKGQLIFTSHNLRPLETIDKGFIVFTTTNPNNRYIRLTNVKGNNNLRDFYFRDILLGEQNEEVYSSTNNYEIALAFEEAGEVFG